MVREGVGFRDRRESSGVEIRKEWRVCDHLLGVDVGVHHRVGRRGGSHDASDDETVLGEPIDDSIELALEMKIGIFNEDPLHDRRSACRYCRKSMLPVVFRAWSGGEAGHEDLVWTRKADGEAALATSVCVRGVRGRADEAVVILPAERAWRGASARDRIDRRARVFQRW